MEAKRTVFFVSDRTGITAQMLGQSILSQFSNIDFNQVTLPFVDSIEKATETAEIIDRASGSNGLRPIVMSTLADSKMRQIVAKTNALFLDCLGTFIVPLEEELGILSSHTIGLAHSASNWVMYHQRIEAVNFSLSHDDGLGAADLESADVVLVGVSRSGKTPTCLYLALQFGVRAANFPLIPEDLEKHKLPDVLRPFKDKLHGLTISAERLHQIRSERRANSEYASMEGCVNEIRLAERIMKNEQLPMLDTTTLSIEELSAMILQRAKLKRQIY